MIVHQSFFLGLKEEDMITFMNLFQSLENLMQHPEDNRNQIRELAQTLTDGGVLDELINEKLEKFNTRWEELQQEVCIISYLISYSFMLNSCQSHSPSHFLNNTIYFLLYDI